MLACAGAVASLAGELPGPASLADRVGAGRRFRAWAPWVWATHAFPGLGKEFMPVLDEGAFLLMPTTMPHASIGEAMDVLRRQDMAIAALPEVSVFGTDLRALFQVGTVNLSVAVWVGFIALFGIATDDGVVMATYLDQVFRGKSPQTRGRVRELVMTAALRRIRPCLMTTATTILALLPVLTATGRGADIMVPMAIPTFGGMCLELMTMIVVPVLYCAREEAKLPADPPATT